MSLAAVETLDFATDKSLIPHEPGFELTPHISGGSELKIWGKFPPNWLGNFTAGLVDEQVNIQDGRVKKLSPLIWGATLSLHEDQPGKLQNLDYMHLVSAISAASSDLSLHLDSFLVEPSRSEPGAYYVEIHGTDQIGFLQKIMKLMSIFSLYPHEIVIDTKDGKVADRFLVTGIGGSEPSQDAIDAFEKRLWEMVSN